MQLKIMAHLGIKDDHYKKYYVKILKDETEVLKSSDIIVQLEMLSDEKFQLLKKTKYLLVF